MALRFSIRNFFQYFSEQFSEYFRFRAFDFFGFFFHVIYPFNLSVMFFLLLYFTPKLFCFPCARLLVCFHAFSTDLPVEFFSLFWNALFCLYCLTLSRYLLSFPSFTHIFWFISSSCIVRFVCCLVLVFSSQHILMCFSFISTFAGCRNFFICSSSLITPPGFCISIWLHLRNHDLLSVEFRFNINYLV